MKEGGKGTFILLSLDHCFSEQEDSDIGRSTICKISIEKYTDFEDLNIEFNHAFLAFAKKNSVVNICKKFNQMVHDSLCVMKVKNLMSG